MKINPLPSWEYLNECFEVDPTSESGLRWKERPLEHFKNVKGINIRWAGNRAGTICNNYWNVYLDKKGIRVHRIVYFLTHPEAVMADLHIDHIDGNTFNNHPDNLRLATTGQNQWNAKVGKNSKYGKGVRRYITKLGFRYRVEIHVNKKRINLGHYGTLDEAREAYQSGAIKYYGEYAHNAQISP